MQCVGDLILPKLVELYRRKEMVSDINRKCSFEFPTTLLRNKPQISL